MTREKAHSKAEFLVQPKEYFYEVVREALSRRKIKTSPLAENYLVQLLEHFMDADNLYHVDEDSGQREHKTLAELFLKAVNAAGSTQVELLKNLGDTSLYISGFFGESLDRKVVDLDYYVGMGGAAYGSLSKTVPDESFRMVYGELSVKFVEFVDALTYISTKSLVQGNENILRLYNKYVNTGSDLAREQLLEKGIVAPPQQGKKSFQ